MSKFIEVTSVKGDPFILNSDSIAVIEITQGHVVIVLSSPIDSRGTIRIAVKENYVDLAVMLGVRNT